MIIEYDLNGERWMLVAAKAGDMTGGWNRDAEDYDLRAAGYVPASEIDRLRAEVEALRKGPSVEELAGVLYATLTLGDDAQAWIVAQTQARAVLKALGRGEG